MSGYRFRLAEFCELRLTDLVGDMKLTESTSRPLAIYLNLKSKICNLQYCITPNPLWF